MILKIYSIFDSAANAYTSPFFMHNDALALRAFEDNVNANNENNIAAHPDQFTLFNLGEFDDSNGTIKNTEPRSLGNGLEYKKPIEIDSQVTTLLQEIRQEIQELK